MEEILIFGHKNPDTDSIMSTLVVEDLEKQAGFNKVKACKLGKINKETEYALKYFKVDEPESLEEIEEGTKVIMVDHNEFAQSVKGIEKAKILKVIDHHKISDFKTSEPLFYMGMPVGCTSTILYDIYETNKMEISKQTAGLMLSAIISDTLLFKSPTSTEKDREVAEKLAKIAGIDIESYGLEMLKAGTDLSDYTPDELINIDSKEFNTKGVKYQVAQVNTASIEDVLKSKAEIEKAMEEYMSKNNIDEFVLAITDILENNSQIIALGSKKDVIEKAFEVNLEDNMAFLPGVVSRKKQIVPAIDKNL